MTRHKSKGRAHIGNLCVTFACVLYRSSHTIVLTCVTHIASKYAVYPWDRWAMCLCSPFFFFLVSEHIILSHKMIQLSTNPTLSGFGKEFWDMHLIPSLKVCIDKRQRGDTNLINDNARIRTGYLYQAYIYSVAPRLPQGDFCQPVFCQACHRGLSSALYFLWQNNVLPCPFLSWG